MQLIARCSSPWRTVRFPAVALLALSMTIVFAGPWVLPAKAADHSPTLDSLIAACPQGQTIPVVLFLDARLTMDDVYPMAQTLPMDARREYVIKTLQTRFNEMSSSVMPRLELARKEGKVTLLRPLWIINAVRVWATPEVLSDMDKNFPEVTYIASDPLYPNTLDNGWGVDSIKAPSVWPTFGANGSGVIVGHKDSGIFYTHPGFAGHIWINPGEDINHDGQITSVDMNGIDDDGDGYVDDFYGWNFDNDNSSVTDRDGHGTRTSSVISSNFTPCDTVSVAPGAKLMILSGFQYQGAVWEASQFAILHGASVLSASLSFKQSDCQTSPPLDCPNYVAHRMVSEMELAAGLIHANSTGNVGLSNPVPVSVCAPGQCPPPAMTSAHLQHGGVSSIVSVNAYNQSGSFCCGGIGPAAWSREDLCIDPRMAFCGAPGHGDEYPSYYNDYPYHNATLPGLFKPDVTAPTQVTSLDGTTSCGSIGGTSGATPHVGGELALIYSAFPGITPERAYLLLVNSCVDGGMPGPDTTWGFGKIQAFAACSTGHATTGYVQGIVTSGGNLVAEVKIKADGNRGVTTDTNGHYLLDLEPGQRTLYLEKFGYNATEVIVSVVAGQTVTQDVTMTAAEAATIQIRATFNGLSPDSAVSISIPKIPFVGLTNGAGILDVPGYAGYYTIIYGRLPWRTDTIEVQVSAPASVVNIELALSPVTLPTGPDAAGYRIFDDYDGVANPLAAYNWVEINPAVGGTGEILTLGNDNTAVRSLPFTGFRFYGATFSSITISANGFIIPGSTSSSEFAATPIPSSLPPNGFFAPWYGDWEPANGGGARVLYLSDATNHRAIVEWYNVPNNAQVARATFEAIFYDPAFVSSSTGNGVVKYQYNAIHGRDEGVVGVENPQGTDGVQYVFQLQYDIHAAPIIAERALWVSADTALSAVPPAGSVLPLEFSLAQNYPNPFNPSTTFSWSVPRTAQIRLVLFDVLGREAAVIYDGECNAGVHERTFRADNLSSGIYFARLESGGKSRAVRKIMLMK